MIFSYSAISTGAYSYLFNSNRYCINPIPRPSRTSGLMRCSASSCAKNFSVDSATSRITAWHLTAAKSPGCNCVIWASLFSAVGMQGLIEI